MLDLVVPAERRPESDILSLAGFAMTLSDDLKERVASVYSLGDMSMREFTALLEVSLRFVHNDLTRIQLRSLRWSVSQATHTRMNVLWSRGQNRYVPC